MFCINCVKGAKARELQSFFFPASTSLDEKFNVDTRTSANMSYEKISSA